MTIDFKLLGSCNHKIQEILNLQGISPNYYADLQFKSNSNSDSTSILELMMHDGLTLFGGNYKGFTNYYFTENGKRVVFGKDAVDVGTLFPDPNPNYIPPNVYFCTYIAALSECPKCLGTKITNDVNFDTSGRIKTVSTHDKVQQQLWKILLTLQGTNILDTTYGSDLSNLIGLKIDEYLAARIQFSILAAINHLIDTQINSGLEDNERISSVSDISANVLESDPREIVISVTVVCADYKEVSSSITLKV